jgi:hypothetical protein
LGVKRTFRSTPARPLCVSKADIEQAASVSVARQLFLVKHSLIANQERVDRVCVLGTD